MPAPPSPIAFIDLKAQQARIRPAVEARFKAVLEKIGLPYTPRNLNSP